uniref:Plexin-A2 n=1 Tax=Cacopsylla melanoneura TaxID=428564 RepID=A0A8D8Y9V6_9HEMI
MFWPLVLLAASFGAGASNSAQDVVRTFSSENGAGSGRFNHLVVDKNTGQIYVGAVNQLYQLTQDLDLIQTELTGPRFDSIDCLTTYCPGNSLFHPSHDQNKVLLIDYFNDRLITCGSVYQGACTIRSLQNISVVVQNVTDPVPVVSNNEEASTIAIIAPGPSNTHVMYVGTTFAGNPGNTSPRTRPGIASRSLDTNSLFQIVNNNVDRHNNTSGSHMFVEKKLEASYIINYVYGFTSEGFSYFLTTQRDTMDDTSPYISKLVRICHNDPKYYSYTEIPITCNSDSEKQYNLVQAGFVGKPGSDLAKDLGIGVMDDVLFAVFAESVNNSNHSNSSSALCVYSLHSIRQNFMKTTEACFLGKGNKGLAFAHGGIRPCVKTNDPINEDFCGSKENHPLGGKQPIKSKSVLNLDVRATAVAATSTGDYTVVFIGTETGHLKKVVVETSSIAIEYGDVKVDEGAIVNADLHLDQKAMHLYVMTERRVSKVKVHECNDCNVYKTCWDCVNRKDPYCGWCSLENKCSLRSECQDSSNDLLSWISYRSRQCPNIVTPCHFQRTTARIILDLTIENLYNFPGQFSCEFSIANGTISTETIKKNNGVTCITPGAELLPTIPAGQHNITTKLSVRSINGPDVVTTSFIFFDCNSYSSCTQCVSSEFPCIWCVNQHRCSHNAKDCSEDSLPVVSRVGQIFKNNLSFCPTIDGTNSSSREILVASNFEKSVNVKVHIVDNFIAQSKFVCLFNIEGRITSVNATLLGDMIYCDRMEFSYTLRQSSIIAPFNVTWGDPNPKPLDNPGNVHLNIYRCRDLADNCGICLSLNEKYGCGWCQSSKSCEILEHCNKGLGIWVEKNLICP